MEICIVYILFFQLTSFPLASKFCNLFCLGTVENTAPLQLHYVNYLPLSCKPSVSHTGETKITLIKLLKIYVTVSAMKDLLQH